MDAYEVAVADARMLVHLQDVSFKRTRQSGAGGVARISLSQPLYEGSWLGEAASVQLRRRASMGPPDFAEAQDVTSAAAVLNAWGITTSPEKLPVFAIPFPLACLVAMQRWDNLVLLTRWHRALAQHSHRRRAQQYEGPISAWPPEDAAVWKQRGEHEQLVHMNDPTLDLTPDRMDQVVSVFRKLAIAVEDPQLREEAGDALGILDAWRSMLNSTMRPECTWAPTSRFKFEAATMVESIRLCSFFRAGSDKLLEIVKRAVILAAPAFLARPLAQSLEDRTKKLPGCTIIRRNELALDITMQLLLHDRSRKGLDMLRHFCLF